MTDHSDEQMNDLDCVSTVYAFNIPFDLCPSCLLTEYSIYSIENISQFSLL